VLLNEYARKFNYDVVPEVAVMGTKGKKVHPDGTVKNLWGLDIGLWESKDEKDDIEAILDYQQMIVRCIFEVKSSSFS